MKQKDPLITRRSYRKAREKNNRKNIWRRLFKQEDEFDDQEEIDNESRPVAPEKLAESEADESQASSSASQEADADLEAAKAASQSGKLEEADQDDREGRLHQRPPIDRFLNWGIIILILAIIVVTAIAFFV
ncbi:MULTISPECIES: hypothetical protein [Aerococcus]|uniref:hypothetical protein n=1 Tax=Aerococcus urinae (strain CCUG 59500 / ACS-120-V-Col10a) TaxID=2976812 RepID=UPI000200E55E|nr:hypothetical protein [Aerococcus sp. Group 1]AEA01822.1 hypothetical protein HMPREF9243_1401 [Aerococcus sp. Group 1]MCY3030850.1 hypothetical protein [Aerococcus sp. Group 1]MCY3055696.1 hypothetical protein [Aerococcus sp. Group 1]MCY3057426.1 hypothetical protein [Aerococcus sp. Group 1]MCY3062362.1 hypothetical protein [Aerococcus sp. Group 1]